jgi:hypothetical protein
MTRVWFVREQGLGGIGLEEIGLEGGNGLEEGNKAPEEGRKAPEEGSTGFEEEG